MKPSSTANHVSNTRTQPPPTGRPQPRPSQPPTPTSFIDYPPPRGSLESAPQQLCVMTSPVRDVTSINRITPPELSSTRMWDYHPYQSTATSAGKISQRWQQFSINSSKNSKDDRSTSTQQDWSDTSTRRDGIRNRIRSTDTLPVHTNRSVTSLYPNWIHCATSSS